MRLNVPMRQPLVSFAAIAVLLVVYLEVVPTVTLHAETAKEKANELLAKTHVRGGLVVHVGCGDGEVTAALGASDCYRVLGLDKDAGRVEEARRFVREQGLYGKVTIRYLDGTHLPLIDNLANLVVVESGNNLPRDEIMRVLCPRGVAYVQSEEKWTATVKPWPKEIDEWTHYLHDGSNNAVAQDFVVGPPKYLQWEAGPRYARHHDRMSSVSAVVSAGGRLFYIIDEASPISILLPPKWTLVARDAFNGTILWKRPIDEWFTHLWPLKSGPAQLPRRLIAIGDRVYVTLGLDAPLAELDAATGETIQVYEETRAAEEVVFANGTLFVLANRNAEKEDYDGRERMGRGYNATIWDELPREIIAIHAPTGETRWSGKHRVLPATLATDGSRVVFHDGSSVVCLDAKTGQENWRTEPVARGDVIRGYYLPILLLYEDVVLFSGGETAAGQTGSWYESGKDTMTAFDASSGKKLWSAYHPPSGYRSPEDMMVANGLVWTGETTSGRAVGVFTGRDPRTGEIKQEFPPDVSTYWFHHRCYRGKATENYLLMSRSGTEFIDVRNEHWTINHWFRGACLYGVMPANGLIYAPQHPCACYLEAKLSGFNALSASRQSVPANQKKPHLQKGHAYQQIPESEARATDPTDWPTYRHDATRDGRASTTVSTSLRSNWKTRIGGRLTSPVVAGGNLFVASIDDHTLHALDATSGDPVWHFTAGGRIDSPPTVYRGQVLFGSADGHVYSLRATNGELVWRFEAAPRQQMLMSYGELESVWPLHGSVLVQDGVLYCVAGRSMFLDGGLHFWRLDPETGKVLSLNVLDNGGTSNGESLEQNISWLNMPPALPDILSSDGTYVYMRSQPFELDGRRLPLQPMPTTGNADQGALPAEHVKQYTHLFSPTGFLDDSWWHRSYWVHGSTFVSGWCGYFLAGKSAPSGRILVFDDDTVYGFGRKPEYYRWTTPIEHHLFAAAKTTLPGDADTSDPKESWIVVPKNKTLNPAGKPLTVEAWVLPTNSRGVVVARGGGSQGYSLYIEQGLPHFVIRSDDEEYVVAGKVKITGRWSHLAGVLTVDGQLQIFVDGKLAGTAEGKPVTVDPAEAMQIGADEGTCVGAYTSPCGFTGTIDEVRIHAAALDAPAIQQSMEGNNAQDPAGDKLALAMSFDKGSAEDLSGNSNHGDVVGARSAPGKRGRGMRFTGSNIRPAGFTVQHHWTKDIPLFARAMVLADKTLFVAGPIDTIDEVQAFRRINDAETQQRLAEHALALTGQQGGMLWAVSASTGEPLAEVPLETTPVFDGMVAANGRLYYAATDGSVVCLIGE